MSAILPDTSKTIIPSISPDQSKISVNPYKKRKEHCFGKISTEHSVSVDQEGSATHRYAVGVSHDLTAAAATAAVAGPALKSVPGTPATGAVAGANAMLPNILPSSSKISNDVTVSSEGSAASHTISFKPVHLTVSESDVEVKVDVSSNVSIGFNVNKNETQVFMETSRDIGKDIQTLRSNAGDHVKHGASKLNDTLSEINDLRSNPVVGMFDDAPGDTTFDMLSFLHPSTSRAGTKSETPSSTLVASSQSLLEPSVPDTIPSDPITFSLDSYGSKNNHETDWNVSATVGYQFESLGPSKNPDADYLIGALASSALGLPIVFVPEGISNLLSDGKQSYVSVLPDGNHLKITRTREYYDLEGRHRPTIEIQLTKQTFEDGVPRNKVTTVFAKSGHEGKTQIALDRALTMMLDKGEKIDGSIKWCRDENTFVLHPSLSSEPAKPSVTAAPKSASEPATSRAPSSSPVPQATPKPSTPVKPSVTAASKPASEPATSRAPSSSPAPQATPKPSTPAKPSVTAAPKPASAPAAFTIPSGSPAPKPASHSDIKKLARETIEKSKNTIVEHKKTLEDVKRNIEEIKSELDEMKSAREATAKKVEKIKKFGSELACTSASHAGREVAGLLIKHKKTGEISSQDVMDATKATVTGTIKGVVTSKAIKVLDKQAGKLITSAFPEVGKKVPGLSTMITTVSVAKAILAPEEGMSREDALWNAGVDLASSQITTAFTAAGTALMPGLGTVAGMFVGSMAASLFSDQMKC